MSYQRATANRRDFFRTPALSGAARAVKAPAVAGAQGTAVKLGAVHPMSGALPYCGQQCRSTVPSNVESRARIAVALLPRSRPAIAASSSSSCART